MLTLPGIRLVRNETTCLKLCGIVLLTFYVIMDVIMLNIFMDTDIVKSSTGKEKSDIYIAFRHLSVKSLMCDHTTQYIIGPSAEYFDEFLHFSTIFSFISPNMISFCHLSVAAVCCKLVSSESLHTRRLGVLLFEFRTWLDSLDGVVYRSHSNTKGIFQSARSTLGYYVDIYCDLFGGVFLMLGVLFYLFKRFDPSRQTQLPWKSEEADSVGRRGGMRSYGFSQFLRGNGSVGTQPSAPQSRKVLFFKCLCCGVAMALAGKFWDNVIDDFKYIFQTPIEDPKLMAMQFSVTHSVPSIIFMWVWRLVEGQAMLQYILLAIFLDKIWEFLNLIQYIGVCFITTLYVVSILYGKYLRGVLHM